MLFPGSEKRRPEPPEFLRFDRKASDRSTSENETDRNVTLPKVLATGFGPFPGTPENPTEALMRALGREPPEAFAARAFRAIVLPTEYRRSWAVLKGVYASFAPDVVVHFGLSARANGIAVERAGCRSCDPTKPEAVGYAPRAGWVAHSGADKLAATLPVDAIVAALRDEGFAADLSDDAGGYVCNATLYRSVSALPPTCRVGFIHVPPHGRGGLDCMRLANAACVILRAAASAGESQGVTTTENDAL
jgi:pyroglutamyl-peptidase